VREIICERAKRSREQSERVFRGLTPFKGKLCGYYSNGSGTKLVTVEAEVDGDHIKYSLNLYCSIQNETNRFTNFTHLE